MMRDLPSARNLALALDGKSIGHGRWMASCPAHQERTPSLSIRDGYAGVLVHCFGGCDQHDVIHALQNLGLWPRREEQKREPRPSRSPSPPLRPDVRDEDNDAFKHNLVRRIWQEAGSCFGTLSQDYLRSREIELDDDLTPRVLRFHPRCQFGPKAQAEFHPTLIAGYTPIVGAVDDDNPVSLHRIALTPNAEKIGKGMALASNAGCVIRLSADEDVTQAIGLAEGVETALAVMMAGWRPVWATGGTATMKNFPLLSGITSLSVFADNDPSGAGLKAAREVVTRYRTAGQWTQIVMPRAKGCDWSDEWGVR